MEEARGRNATEVASNKPWPSNSQRQAKLKQEGSKALLDSFTLVLMFSQEAPVSLLHSVPPLGSVCRDVSHVLGAPEAIPEFLEATKRQNLWFWE